MLIRKKKVVGLTAVVVAAGLVLTACSSSGGANAHETTAASGGGGGGAVADTPNFTIAMITHESAGDTFWDRIRSGAEAAAAKDNITLKYSNNDAADQQATLVQNAVDSKVDAIATTLSTPDAMKGAMEGVNAAGIPWVAFNAGIDAYKDLGGLMYFGSDETIAGQAIGDRLTQLGAKHPMCVIQTAGQTQLEARCKGVTDKAANVENLQVNGVDLPSVTSTIAAKLQSDPSIDYVITLGANIAVAAVESVKQSKSTAKVGTFDLNPDAAKAIQDGSLLFAVDQQPFLEGYQAVDNLWLYLTNRNVLGGGQPVLTGPAFVDSDNIDVILPFVQANTR
jgi:simple sugar transport system substrate-binding protein